MHFEVQHAASEHVLGSAELQVMLLDRVTFLTLPVRLS